MDHDAEYVLRMKPGEGRGPYVWLSVRQCYICKALIVEGFMHDHINWHDLETDRVIGSLSQMRREW